MRNTDRLETPTKVQIVPLALESPGGTLPIKTD